jgi:hypothetical protein
MTKKNIAWLRWSYSKPFTSQIYTYSHQTVHRYLSALPLLRGTGVNPLYREITIKYIYHLSA